MRKRFVPVWKQMPVFRLLVSFVIGILAQFYFHPSILLSSLTGIASFIFLIAFQRFSITKLYRFYWIGGLCISLLLISAGSIITSLKNANTNANWLGHYYADSCTIQLVIEEPLVEKEKSYKALASIRAINKADQQIECVGKVLLYFKKDSIPPNLQYGSTIITSSILQPIKNAGNPGAFNYQQYCAFQGIYHQLFLQSKDYIVSTEKNTNPFKSLLYRARAWVIQQIKQTVPGEKEQGVAEALLIGFRDDLDKELVQDYSNTGVVHIIAISGLHLGMIYGLLIACFGYFKKSKILTPWVQVFVILIVLWGFSILAGMAPSILRSAYMFSFLTIGNAIDKRGNNLNNLCASAFLILLIDPFALWDVGFQLSYSAVLSIMLFQKPIRNWLFIKNKWIDHVWQLNAVTISAQILTLPIVLFHFHQFPNLFLFTNLVAVPLSGFILYAELLLLIVAQIPFVGHWVGQIIHWLILGMNNFISWMSRVPMAITDNIQISLLQSFVLMFALFFFCYAFMHKSKKLFFGFTICTIMFFGLRIFSFYNANNQHQIIVYNVPQKQAVDLVNGRSFVFVGHSALLTNGFLQNFHLKPSRTMFRMQRTDSMDAIFAHPPFFDIDGKHIAVIDSSINYEMPLQKIKVDVLVLGGNPKIYINNLLKQFECKQIVFDGSANKRKCKYWKHDCDSLHIAWHDVSEQGAWVMRW
jgi:competence protein ComEC